MSRCRKKDGIRCAGKVTIDLKRLPARYTLTPKCDRNMAKKICAVTMARNDMFFLTKWVDYYGSQLGKGHLYIFLDGEDQLPPPNADGANITYCKHVPENVTAGDRTRIGKLSAAAAGLLERYDLVIGTDADEFLVVDPRTGKSLPEYLSGISVRTSVSALGMDVGQKTGDETAIDADRPFLSQRGYALVSTRYTKTSVISEPVEWGSGFHRVRRRNFRIDRNLYLFHFGCVDTGMVEARFKDGDRMKAGWEHHLRKRLRTITLISGKKAHRSERWISFARFLQSVVRPPYAWNKPAMFGWRLIVRIPDRFRDSV